MSKYVDTRLKRLNIVFAFCCFFFFFKGKFTFYKTLNYRIAYIASFFYMAKKKKEVGGAQWILASSFQVIFVIHPQDWSIPSPKALKSYTIFVVK